MALTQDYNTTASQGSHGSPRELNTQLANARKLQRAILPSGFPAMVNLTGAARMEPALEMSGDFYDVIELQDGRLGIVMADVSGKGVPAAFFMAVARTTLRSCALTHLDTGQCLSAANEELYRQNPQMFFVTVMYAIVDPWSFRVEIASAGHEQPLLVTPEGQVITVPVESGVALGILEATEFPVTVFELVAGESLFAYTDGVTEAENGQAEFFGLERLRETLAQNSGTAEEKLQRVYAGVAAFVEDHPQHDDLTAMLLCVAEDAERMV